MVTRKISDAFLRSKLNKPNERIELFSLGGNGLFVQISKTGYISFIYRYRYAKKQVKLTIGEYPRVGIKAARNKHEELFNIYREGMGFLCKKNRRYLSRRVWAVHPQ